VGVGLGGGVGAAGRGATAAAWTAAFAGAGPELEGGSVKEEQPRAQDAAARRYGRRRAVVIGA
jgi:hypothetical protein